MSVVDLADIFRDKSLSLEFDYFIYSVSEIHTLCKIFKVGKVSMDFYIICYFKGNVTTSV